MKTTIHFLPIEDRPKPFGCFIPVAVRGSCVALRSVSDEIRQHPSYCSNADTKSRSSFSSATL